MRRLAQLATVLLTGVAAVVVLALPAAANTVNVRPATGTLTLRNPGGGTVTALDLSARPCSVAPSTLTTTTPNTVSATLRYKHRINSGGDWILDTTFTLTGSFSGSPPTYSMSGTGTVTIVARSTTSPTACSSIAAPCTLTASNVAWSGTLSAANALALDAPAQATIAGGNSAFNTIVTGGPCPLTPVNFGSVMATGLSLDVNTVDVAVGGGDLDLYSSANTYLGWISLTPPCGAASSTAWTNGSGAISATLRSTVALFLAGQSHVLAITIQLAGTYTGTSPTYSMTGTGTITIVSHRSTGAGSCTPMGPPCTVTAVNETWAGTLTATNAAVLTTGDTGTVAGTNAVFNTTISGSCGAFTALNNGRIAFTGVQLTVL